MRHPNWSGYASESAMEAAQEEQGAYWKDLRRDVSCAWCSEPLPDDEYRPFCSPECDYESQRETPDSIHPRPEEVG